MGNRESGAENGALKKVLSSRIPGFIGVRDPLSAFRYIEQQQIPPCGSG
jgi:hypothetical protein